MENEINDMAFIGQKIICDKTDGSVSTFVTISDTTFKISEWVGNSKFLALGEEYENNTSNGIVIKKSYKGNPDEGKDSVDGKALFPSVEKDLVKIDVLVEKFTDKDNWILSHSHYIKKNIFDAFVLVIKTNVLTNKAEKEHRDSSTLILKRQKK